MMRAIVQDGVIVPLQPLPEDWAEGTEVNVERWSIAPSNGGMHKHKDAWDELETFVQDNDPEDERRLEEAIAELRRKFWRMP